MTATLKYFLCERSTDIYEAPKPSGERFFERTVRMEEFAGPPARYSFIRTKEDNPPRLRFFKVLSVVERVTLDWGSEEIFSSGPRFDVYIVEVNERDLLT